MVLEDRVHLHFQERLQTAGASLGQTGRSEIWHTFEAGETWSVPGADLHITVCSIVAGAFTALVAVAATVATSD